MEFLARLGQMAMLLGMLVSVAAQVVAFIRIVKHSIGHAALALLIPGFLLYYVWRSEYRMPRVLRAWAAGIAAFVFGAVIVGVTV